MLTLYLMIAGAVAIALGFAIAILRHDRHAHHKP